MANRQMEVKMTQKRHDMNQSLSDRAHSAKNDRNCRAQNFKLLTKFRRKTNGSFHDINFKLISSVKRVFECVCFELIEIELFSLVLFVLFCL